MMSHEHEVLLIKQKKVDENYGEIISERME